VGDARPGEQPTAGQSVLAKCERTANETARLNTVQIGLTVNDNHRAAGQVDELPRTGLVGVPDGVALRLVGFTPRCSLCAPRRHHGAAIQLNGLAWVDVAAENMGHTTRDVLGAEGVCWLANSESESRNRLAVESLMSHQPVRSNSHGLFGCVYPCAGSPAIGYQSNRDAADDDACGSVANGQAWSADRKRSTHSVSVVVARNDKGGNPACDGPEQSVCGCDGRLGWARTVKYVSAVNDSVDLTTQGRCQSVFHCRGVVMGSCPAGMGSFIGASDA
jgi:hypothetical protein